MLVDIIFIILLVMAIFKGYSRGLIVALFSFFAFLVGIAAALKLSASVASSLQEKANLSGSWLPVLSFMLVFVGVILLVRLGARLIKKAVSVVLLGWADTLGGILLYTFLYLFLYSVVLFYAAKIGLVSAEMQAASKTFDLIAPLGPKVIEWLGLVIPFFSNMFAELSSFFGKVSADRH